jgi:Na+/H+ antiporter NhaC
VTPSTYCVLCVSSLHGRLFVISFCTHTFSFFLYCIIYSLLGLGYKLDQIISAAEETKRIRKSRQQNMKGKWDQFKKVFEVAAGMGKLVGAQPKIIAGKSA